MFGSVVLEVGIGVILLFLFVSLICTAAMEGIKSLLKMRAVDLERGIRELLNDRDGTKGIVAVLYQHPLIYSLFGGEYKPLQSAPADPNPAATSAGIKRGWLPFSTGGNLPSYIPAANFAGALLDIAAHGLDPS